MPTTTHDSKYPPAQHDIEVRIKNFRGYVSMAFQRFTVLALVVGPLWLCIKAVPSEGAIPLFPTVAVPFLVRWLCIVLSYFASISKMAPLLHIIIYLTMRHIPEIEEDNHPRDLSPSARTTDVEDWILANVCVIAVLTTISFTAGYWLEVLRLTLGCIFYWMCSMAGLGLLVWLFGQGFRFYRYLKNFRKEEICGVMLIGPNIIRLLADYEWLTSETLLGALREGALVVSRLDMMKFLLDLIGYTIGSGPLFDRLPDEAKAERRACQSWDEVTKIFAFAAGGPLDEETDSKDDTDDSNDKGESCMSPSACEWGPNPVIFAHLLGYYDSFEHFSAGNSLDCQLTNTPGRYFSPDTITGLHSSMFAQGDLNILEGMTQSGPTTMSVNLHHHACQQCDFRTKNKSTLKYAFVLLSNLINAEMRW